MLPMEMFFGGKDGKDDNVVMANIQGVNQHLMNNILNNEDTYDLLWVEKKLQRS